jgi:hypothetical protein
MIALVSCAPALSPTPTPAPLPYLAVTPALQPWFEARASAFVSEEGALDFFPLLRQPGEIQDALQSGEAQLAIAGTEAPPEGFITPLGDEAIAVITHPANPLTSLSSEEISRIFSGRVDSWSQVDGDSHRIQPYIPLAGDEVRSQFASQLMQGAHFTTNAVLAPSPHAMLEAVAEDEGGIGLLPISAMHPSVKAIALDDVTPDPAGPAPSDYALRLHVLAFAPQEPVGALRTWLGWVQARELATNHE